MDVRRSLLPPLLAAIALTGCGTTATQGSSASTATDPTTTTALPAPTSPVEPTLPSAAPDDSWSPWATGLPTTDLTDLAGTASAGFTAADGVVACLFTTASDGDAEVRCDRTEGLGVDQPRPPGCDGAWGDAVVASVRDGGGLVCGGRPVRDDSGAPDGSRRLPDGEAVTYEGLTCAARDARVQCLSPDRSSGSRGFVVSARVVVVR